MGLRVLFAAGGTGGHIFPALAVADTCRALAPDTAIEFVGTRGRLEERVVPRAGYPLNYLWISGFQRNLSLKTLLLPAKIGTSFLQAVTLLRRFRPDVVVCAGAYVSYPIGMAASTMKIPLVLMESNALPGLVIRRLAPRAAEVHVAFNATNGHLPGARLVLSGNPVRRVLFEPQEQHEARLHFGLDVTRPTLFAFGGSLGARSINDALDSVIDALIADGIQVIWQTGSSYAGGEKRTGHLYRANFIHEMEKGYAAADLVLARAGATTIAELEAVGKPSILVPLPTAADDHQRLNAVALEREGASRMILDADLRQHLLPAIRATIRDSAALEEMARNAARLAIPDAHERIARRVLEIAAGHAAGRHARAGAVMQ
ncbi:MAG TPA: undecaprenyldiphospho-muramoylpentapeptide beta-N-acetylglucosaminyltransferase [Candidatus Kapabacteria bacterium]|nr:undecaprenyldiphospho-muramoylpentapeptide beta-N-acetylglucosaminyltransferase [Candidatus Kapabacteria bacterium]